ncbi:autophagy-related protein 27 [Scleroderma yunnanense]
MTFRTTPLSPAQVFSAVLLLSTLLVCAAQESGSPFNCQPTLDGTTYDLTSLKGAHVVTRERDSPPSKFFDELRFDLCAELQPVDGRLDEDQCPSGTVACLTKTNRKGGEDTDRITAVIPVAYISSLSPEVSALSSSEGLSIILHGSSYPGSASNSTPQSLKINLACAESASSPSFSAYVDGQVTIEWSSPFACKTPQEHPPKEDDKKGSDESGGKPDDVPIEHVGSGLGFFFLMFMLAFCAYFCLGAYYNYSTYGARGLDLIPHRDFWREVPYMLQDVLSHLCSNIRPRRSSRGGYIAV